jgi:hypothetical protein
VMTQSSGADAPIAPASVSAAVTGCNSDAPPPVPEPVAYAGADVREWTPAEVQTEGVR